MLPLPPPSRPTPTGSHLRGRDGYRAPLPHSHPCPWQRAVCVAAAVADRSSIRVSAVPEHTVLGMSALSPSMYDGGIVQWHVKAGDEIEPGDELCDIETDKATVALEAWPDVGFLAKILLDDESGGGTRVPIGTPMAVFVEDKADIVAFEDFEPPPPPRPLPTKPRASRPHPRPCP